MLETALFYLISLGVLASAIGVVLTRSAVYSVLCLVSAMCFMAGLFVLLKAFLVATVLVLVYAGAILVLFLFVVMLIDFRKLTLPPWQGFRLPPIFAGILAIAFFAEFFYVIKTVSLPAQEALHGTTREIGLVLFNQYLLPFELTSFLVLSAVVSVVVLAKKDAK